MLEMKINDHEWRIIPYESSSAAWNSAVDHALLEVMNAKLKNNEKVKPIVRTYQFTKGAVVLGYEQSDSTLNTSQLNGHDFTTRVSGGGHMFLSPKDVHYCTIVPLELAPQDTIDSYRMLNEPVVKALKSLGYNARLGRMSIKIDMDEEKTLVGTAQRRMTYAMLQHGSVLVKNYTPNIFSLLNAKEDQINVWEDKIITLSELNGLISSTRIAEEIERQFDKKEYSGLNTQEKTVAKKTYKEIYNNPNVVGKGLKIKPHICLLEGLMTKDYQAHVEDNSGNGQT
jgi:lipoate-protein ligase A